MARPFGRSRLAAAMALAFMAGCFDARLEAATTAGRDKPRADAGTSDSGMASTDAGAQTRRHPSCQTEPERARPAAASVALNTLTIDTNTQNGWRQIDCTRAPTLVRCDRSDAPCTDASHCIYPTDDEQGFCVDTSGKAPTTYRGGSCLMSLTDEHHAALCCARVAGVDCERWPHTKLGGPGGLCVNDRQCEAGLLCVATSASYGRCACPEAAGGIVAADDAVCGHPSAARDWGQPSERLALGECVPAATAGYVIEALTAPANLGPTYRFTVDAEGLVYPWFTLEEALHILSPRALSWPLLEEVPPVGELRHFVLVLAELKATPSEPREVALAFEADGTAQLAFLAENEVVVARASAGGWQTETRPAPGTSGLWFAIVDGESWLVFTSETYVGADRKDAAGWTRWMVPGAYGECDILAWPNRGVHLLCAEAIGGSFRALDPMTGESHGLVPYGSRRVVSGTDLFTAPSAVMGGGRADVVLVAVASDGTTGSEMVWSDVGSRVDGEEPLPRIGLTVGGAVGVAHRTPDGIGLSRKDGAGAWQVTTLSTDHAAPVGVFHTEGGLAIFYAADSDWDGAPDQLRRIREGTCP